MQGRAYHHLPSTWWAFGYSRYWLQAVQSPAGDDSIGTTSWWYYSDRSRAPLHVDCQKCNSSEMLGVMTSGVRCTPKQRCLSIVQRFAFWRACSHQLPALCSIPQSQSGTTKHRDIHAASYIFFGFPAEGRAIRLRSVASKSRGVRAGP
jgi:hypothetical protein